MSKVNISTQGGQLSDLQKLATADLPTGEPVSPAPAPSQEPGGALDRLMAGPVAQDLPAEVAGAIDEGIQAGVGVQQEAERHAIDPLQDRFKQAVTTPEPTRWLQQPKRRPDEVPLSQQVDGGIAGRASAMATAVERGELFPSTQFKHTPGREAIEAGDQVAGAEAIAEANADKGSLVAAIARSGGVGLNGRPDPNYVKYAAYVTENFMADLSFGDTEAEVSQDPVAAALGETTTAPAKPAEPQTFSKGQGDEVLGNKIHQEFQRAQGQQEPSKLPAQEAAVLGSAFKEMWAKQNPKYVKDIPNPGGPKTYQLTAEGQVALEQGATLRKRLFNKNKVRPTKAPIPTGQIPGGASTQVKNASGRIGNAKFGGVIESARFNLSQVPNVVDKQRAKILLATIIPVLNDPTSQRDPNHPNAWMAEINNIGPSKYSSYTAAQKSAERKMQETPGLVIDYNKDHVMSDLTNKVAQEVQAIAQERNGANYLSYYVQAFNGRIAPQQTIFDPTSSKAVRFVTRNATPSIAKPGTRVEKNLRQMYAMQLLGKIKAPGTAIHGIKGDALLPELREAALVRESGRLEKWGDMLAQSISMTDAEYEIVAQAISDGKPLDDPAFEAVKPIALEDPELIAAIKAKGEDGPHFIDGLIDFAKYQKAKRKGQPYASYFNAYIDGKTNGIASNGIQMGSRETALSTGVLRANRTQLLDAGDIRDQVQQFALDMVDEGWDGDTSEYESDLNTVARAVYSNREFNKHTTMTFGYGKEIASFADKVSEVIGELSETSPDVAAAATAIPLSPKDLAETILNKYTPALEQALSTEAIKSRKIMRSAAALHSAVNALFSIKSYTGMDLNLGRDLAVDSTQGQEHEYAIYEDGKRERKFAYTYDREATSAAARSRTNADGEVTVTPGDYAYGGSLPGPVQSLDAATVAMSASGRSWDRLKMNSGGNPYMHSIYDAFKTDANGFDVVVEEVNSNWLDATGEWSYLEQTLESVDRAAKEFQAKVKEDGPNRKLRENEKIYMDWMLQMGTSASGNPDMSNLRAKLKGLQDYNSQQEINKAIEKIKHGMMQVGYNVNNPPAEPTMGQLGQFVKLFAGELNVRSRLQSMIATTNTKKRKLVDEIKRSGYKTPSGKRIALQYYAH